MDLMTQAIIWQQPSLKPPFEHLMGGRQAPLFKGTMSPIAQNGMRDRFLGMMAQNQVMSRSFIEIFGYAIWNVLFARNNWERLERASDSVSWLAVGVAVPVVVGNAMVRGFTNTLKKRFPKAFIPGAVHKPVHLPFQWLEQGDFAKRWAPQALNKLPLAQYGLKTLPRAMAQALLKQKLLGIMMMDALVIWTQANAFAWGRNLMTEKLSKQKGFSGVFTEASEAYRQKEAERYEAQKAKRLKVSMLMSLAASVGFPLGLYGLLSHRAKPGSASVMGKLKAMTTQVIPKLNYNNAVFISKYALLWYCIWTYNVSMLAAARDKNEFRENLTKALCLDFFYFIGDDYIAGHLAKHLQNRYKKPLKGFKLLHKGKGLFGNPEAKGFHELLLAANKMKDPVQKALVKRFGMMTLLSGLAGTALCLGISMTLLTQWYTRQKLRQEEERIKRPMVVLKTRT